MGSSQTRARTRVPCIVRQILNHCATREAPKLLLINSYINIIFKNQTPYSTSKLSHYYKMGVSLGDVKYVLCQIQSPPALHENIGGDIVHFKHDKM